MKRGARVQRAMQQGGAEERRARGGSEIERQVTAAWERRNCVQTERMTAHGPTNEIHISTTRGKRPHPTEEQCFQHTACGKPSHPFPCRPLSGSPGWSLPAGTSAKAGELGPPPFPTLLAGRSGHPRPAPSFLCSLGTFLSRVSVAGLHACGRRPRLRCRPASPPLSPGFPSAGSFLARCTALEDVSRPPHRPPRAVVIFHTVLNMSFGLAHIRWTSLGTCP